MGSDIMGWARSRKALVKREGREIYGIVWRDLELDNGGATASWVLLGLKGNLARFPLKNCRVGAWNSRRNWENGDWIHLNSRSWFMGEYFGVNPCLLKDNHNFWHCPSLPSHSSLNLGIFWGKSLFAEGQPQFLALSFPALPFQPSF